MISSSFGQYPSSILYPFSTKLNDSFKEPKSNLKDIYGSTATVYVVIAAMKELKLALQNNTSVDLSRFENNAVWQHILELEQTAKDRSFATTVFISHLTERINLFAQQVFSLDKTFYLNYINEAINKFPMRNKTDIETLSHTLNLIFDIKDGFTDSEKAQIINNLNSKCDDKIKKAIENLIDLYIDDDYAICTFPEILKLFRQQMREIAIEKSASLQDSKNHEALIQQYTTADKKLESQSSSSKSAAAALANVMKREIKEEPSPTKEQIKALCPNASDTRLEEIENILKYLKERKVTFSKFSKLDKEIRDLFLNGFNTLINDPDLGTLGDGPVGELMYRGVSFEQLVFEDGDKAKAALVLNTIITIRKLCNKPVNFSFASLTSLSFEKLSFLIREFDSITNICENFPISPKFLSVLPLSILLDLKNQIHPVITSKFACFDLMQKTIYEGTTTFLDKFEELNEADKEVIFDFFNFEIVKFFIESKIPLPMIIEFCRGPYHHGGFFSKYKYFLVNNAELIKKTLLLGISPKEIFKLADNFGLCKHSDNFANLMALATSPTRTTADQKFSEILRVYCDGECDLELVIEHIDMAILFVGSKIELSELAEMSISVWHDLHRIAEKAPNLCKSLEKKHLAILDKHSYEIKLFLEKGMPPEAVSTLEADKWTQIASVSAGVLDDLSKKVEWSKIVEKYTTKSLDISVKKRKAAS